MLSNLKLLVLENPTVEFVLEQLDSLDKNRLESWYEKSTHTVEEFNVILETFLWCCTEGEYVADTQNPEIFIKTFEEKATELGLNKEMLSSLYFSHSTLFNDYKNANEQEPDKPLFIVFQWRACCCHHPPGRRWGGYHHPSHPRMG